MDTRTELLNAAAAVFSQHGFRGSTTRRIAEAAGVNEVTLFRYFGSKEALLQEAIASSADGQFAAALPLTPIDPEHELAEWVGALIERLHSRASIIRKCMSEIEERPEMISTAVSTPVRASTDLAAYLRKLRSLGLADPDFDIAAAATMLMGAVFHDAMGREMMPQLYPPASRAPRLYSRLLLTAIGFKAGAKGTDSGPTNKKHKPTISS
jgi:AcrR family transcriptional regulator